MIHSDEQNDLSERAKPTEISPEDIDANTLGSLIKEFILPGGTDYGMTEAAYDAKERQVRKQIASGSLRIVSVPEADEMMLMGAQQWRELSR